MRASEDAERPRTQSEWFGEMARDAFERGERALALDDLAGALRWLARAHRIAPDDPAGALALASAMLRAGDDGATALFRAVADRTDAREAWLGLAAAHHAAGRREEASAALGRALSRFAVPSHVAAVALFSAIARAVGAPGWCRIDPDLRLHCVSLDAAAPAVLVDGRPHRSGARLPRAASVSVVAGGRHLLGSPLDLGGMRRVEGFVECQGGDLVGWASHPAAPDRAPDVLLAGLAGGRAVRIRIESGPAMSGHGLARRYGFRVQATTVAGFAGAVRVGGSDGGDFLGSPLSISVPASPARPAVIQSRARSPTAAALPRAVAVVIPVHRGRAVTLACLDAVAATTPAGTQVIVVDDATPEPDLAVALDSAQRAGRIRLVRHRRNKGFPASANAGLRAALALAGARDVVLLNNDTLATPGWLERLRAAVHATTDVGTATPFSNDASIVSYPHPDAPGPMPDPAGARRLARWASRANPAVAIEVPTAVGFCMYIRRECLEATGVLREDVFAQGYGEENDFCMRARAGGWRHVAVPGAYVAHVGGRSFGDARTHLMARNLAVLERLHPGYHAEIAAFVARDPLGPARRRLDRLRFAAGRARGGAVAVITHASGGGVERVVQARLAAIRADGRRPILLRPVVDETSDERHRRYRPGVCEVGDDSGEVFSGLTYRLPDQGQDLVALLVRERPASVEVHHTLGHHPWVMELGAVLGVPTDVHVHDYAAFCPRITLVGPTDHYCGEPVDPSVCDACVARAGARIEEDIPVAALRARSARHLAAARRVIVPSADAAARMRRHFRALRPQVAAHEDDDARPPLTLRPSNGEQVVVVIGAIGVEKGYGVLLACARDAAARRLPLAFTVVGHTMDDAALLDTGRVFVTGPYREDEAVALIAAQRASVAFLPSIWPETWCFTLGHAWRAGLAVVAFDIGAPAERIRRTGQGTLLPLGLQPLSINQALLAATASAGNEYDHCSTGPATRVRA